MSTLSRIEEKVRAGVRLDLEDGVLLFTTKELLRIGALANEVRERLHGDRTYFNRNLHINATNVCVASCMFCSFARLEEGMPGAYTMSLEEAFGKLSAQDTHFLSEIHIVNGLHPTLPFDYYEDLLRGLKRIRPDIHLKCFTAVEIHFFAEKFGMTYREVLERLRAAGLDSLPGGGAEIFSARYRRKICHDKVDADGWLEVHRVAHAMGIRSNATMLYGMIETAEERADHLLRLRALQDETGGFQTFIPLAFHNEGNPLRKLPEPTGFDNLRVYAASRLLLDNVPHLKAYWIMVGEKIAQVAQSFGVDDIDGTVLEERIYHMAGADTPQGLTRAELVRLIREAGRRPVERDTLYHVIWEEGQPVPERTPPRSAPHAPVRLPVTP